MKFNCATLFNPQYTHLKKGKDILRVTVYGFPARYKRVNTETIEEKIVDKQEDSQGNVTTRTVSKSRSLPNQKPKQRKKR